MNGSPADAACRDTHCVTCADEGTPMRVVALRPGGLGVCTDGTVERDVDTTLVGPVAPGDRLLVHAGVALARLAEGTA